MGVAVKLNSTMYNWNQLQIEINIRFSARVEKTNQFIGLRKLSHKYPDYENGFGWNVGFPIRSFSFGTKVSNDNFASDVVCITNEKRDNLKSYQGG